MYKRLLFTTFDPDVAPFFGVSTEWVDTMFSLILAGTIVVSMQMLGVTLIAATLVIPPITARLLTDNFTRLMTLSVIIGALCGLVGIYGSYYVDISSGASIVLVASAVFVGGDGLFGDAAPAHDRTRHCRAEPGATAAAIRLRWLLDADVVAVYLHGVGRNRLRRRRCHHFARSQR